MGQKKISIIQLEQLVREGNGVSQIAKKLNVTKGAVSKALKRLNVAISKDVTLRSAPQMVEKRIDAMSQLININNLINSELDYIEDSIQTASAKERKELQDQKLKHVSEVRKQLGLLLNIAQTFYSLDEVKHFQEVVIKAIGSVSSELRKKIIDALHQESAIKSTIEFS
jgi:transposase